MFLFFTIFSFEITITVSPGTDGNIATITGDGIISRSEILKNSYTTFSEVIIKNGPTGIDTSAFQDCSNLKNVTLSHSIQTLSGSSFRRCSKTQAFIVPDDHLYFSSDSQGALYNFNKTILYQCPSSISSFVIPDTVETIQNSCFTSNTLIQNFLIPASLICYEYNSFNECTGVSTLSYAPGSQLKEIGSGPFRYASITEVHIPSSVERILDNAFYYARIKTLIFDDISNSNLTFLGSQCFGVFLGTSITLPSGITEIPSNCFISSTNLLSITIPKDCTSIDLTAFSGCGSLSSITVDEGNEHFTSISDALYTYDLKSLYFIPPKLETLVLPSNLETIAQSVIQSSGLKYIDASSNTNFQTEDGVLYNSDWTSLIGVCGGVTDVTVNPNTEIIEAFSFSLVDVLTVSFDQAANLKHIKESAFYNCLKLVSVSLPNTLQYLEASAFEGCKSLDVVDIDANAPLESFNSIVFQRSTLKNMTLPLNVKTIQNRCFYYCTSMQKFIIPYGSKLEKIYAEVFYADTQLVVEGYPSSLTLIDYSAFYGCSSLTFPFSNAPNIKQINKEAFLNCKVDYIELPSINSLAANAFGNCKSLKMVVFNESATIDSLPSSLFTSCTVLETIVFSKSISQIDPSFVANCWSLIEFNCNMNDYFSSQNGVLYSKEWTSLILCSPGTKSCSIKEETISIGISAFSGCSIIETVDFSGSNLETLSDYAFYECTALKTIRLTSNIKTLGISIFKGCKLLSYLPFDASSKFDTLPSSSFAETGLQKLVIPSFIKTISSDCFSKCSSLHFVEITSQVESIGSGTFSGCTSLSYAKYCGTNINVEGAAFDSHVIVYVSDLFIDALFGTNTISRVLDPECTLITANYLYDEELWLIAAVACIADEN